MTLLPLPAGCRRSDGGANSTSATVPAPTTRPPWPATAPVKAVVPAFAAIIAHPVRVEARRIRYTTPTTTQVNQDVFPAPELGPAVTVDAAAVGRLSSALLDPATYDLGSMTMCFEPGVQFEFFGPDRSVRVKVCFACDMLKMGSVGQEPAGLEVLDFKPGHARLLAVTRGVFPGDVDLR